MVASCYILYSKGLDKFYVGVTHDTVVQRLDRHHLHSCGSHRFTATTNDWEVFLILETDDYAHAIRM